MNISDAEIIIGNALRSTLYEYGQELQIPYVPPTLYHYTDAEAFRSILESKTIRAGAIRYLNDTSEGVHGARAILRYMATWFPADNLLQLLKCAIVAYVSNRINSPGANDRNGICDRSFHMYAACFSAKVDLLSQWRGYGANGCGYALGFDGYRLWHEPLQPPYHTSPVFYAVDKQQAIIARVMTYLETHLPQAATDVADQTPDKWVPDLVDYLVPFMKHPAYSEEEEWRLFMWDADLADVEIRSRDGEFIPYVSLKPAAGLKLPITHIVVGPSLDFPKAFNSIEMLLNKTGYDPTAIDIRPSEVPYKS